MKSTPSPQGSVPAGPTGWRARLLPPVPSSPTGPGGRVDPTALKRPVTVVIGCAMAVTGALILIISGSAGLGVDEQSEVIKGVDPEDVQGRIEFFHTAAIVSLSVAALLIIGAATAYLGFRWGAKVLMALCGLAVLYFVVGLFIGFSIESVSVTLWSISSATLVALRPPSRFWFNSLEIDRAAKKRVPPTA